MGKHIDWYLVEIERRLTGRVPQTIVVELISEVQEHLMSAVEDQGSRSENLDDKEKSAIRRFGDPGKIALRLIIAHTPKEKPTLAKWPVVIAGAATLWGGIGLSLGLQSGLTAILYGIPLFVVAFCLASALARRARPWATAGVVASGFIFTWAFLTLTWLNLYTVGGMGLVPKWQVGDYRAAVKEEMNLWSAEIPKLESGVVAFRLPNDPAQDAFRVKGGWRIPVATGSGWWDGPPVSGRAKRHAMVQYGVVGDRAEAERAWKTTGRNALDSLETTIESEQANLMALDRATRVPMVQRAKESFDILAPIATLWLLALIVTNFIFSWLGEGLYRLGFGRFRAVA